MLYCNPLLAQEPEPDPNLLWVSDSSWENGFHRFLVHPNGNILAGIGSTEFELDGNTGMIIREFESPVVFFDISPDGKYISANDKYNWKCVIDYETGEVIHQVTNLHTKPMFMPDSRTLVYFVVEPISGLKGNLKLQSYNIDTKEYKSSANFIQNTTSETIAISPDGKLIATSGRNFVSDEDGYTELILWDAETLAPIKYLRQFESYQPVRSIKFSPDSKFVGFGVYPDDLYIYETENLSLYKYDGSTYGFGFVTSDFIAIGNGKIDPPELNLVNLHTDQIIYTINNTGASAVHNRANNTMVVIYGNLYCYDFEKILTGASIEPEIPNPFTIEYINNSLMIRNYTFGANLINCSITDINGRIIRNIDLHTPTGDIRIPIKLQSGTYFLHIKDGDRENVSKFLVTN